MSATFDPQRTPTEIMTFKDWLIDQIEHWSHEELDKKYKTIGDTHRWHLCIPPSGDMEEFNRNFNDCACCLMKPEDYRDTECQCYCHERVRSLANFIAQKMIDRVVWNA